jgi:TIR domain
MAIAPKVFLSHASEDKDRFVMRFATALRAKGVDVWLDRWEMLPGDKLIQKIFDEGLENAAAVIVVLSTHSVAKPWVREELDAAAIKRINSGSKLIPVVLDDCKIPLVLQSTIWHRVADLTNLDEDVERIAAAIFDHRTKPPLGESPVYSSPAYATLPGLSPTDTFVLMETCKRVIETDELFVDPEEMFLQSDAPQVSKEQVIDSIDMLEQRGYVVVERYGSPGPYPYRATNEGLELYLANHFPQYEALVRKVMGVIVNEDLTASIFIAEHLETSHKLATHILRRLENMGHIRIDQMLDGVTHVHHVSPSLKRAFESAP